MVFTTILLVASALAPTNTAGAAGISIAGRNVYGTHPDPKVIVERRPLWPEGRMPDAQEHQMPVPELQWYAPPASHLRTGTCMILVSGGSYQELSDFFVLDEVADYLTAKGVQCVNLAYRVPRPKGLPKYQSAWEDGQRAIRLVRSEAAKRGYDPEKIGALGTSAGGHAVLMMTLNSQSPAYARVDDLDDVPCHLNVAVPIFPGHCLHVGDETSWSLENGRTDISLSPVLSFDAKTPPVCLMHGGIDWVSPLGSVLVYEELRRRKMPAEIHLIADRNHGFMLGAKEGTASFTWKDRVAEFLLQLGFLGPVPPEKPLENRRTDAFTHSVTREPLWPEGKMPDVRTNQTEAPYMEWYLPKKVATYSVQMVFPGGGYDKVSEPWEGKYVAERFNEYGMAAVVVHYRTPHPVGMPDYYSAWQDAQRAIRLVRRGAKRKGLNSDSIGAIGFSAGGNLVLHCATRSLKPAYARVDETDDLPCSFQWAIPIYPWHVLDGNVDTGGIVKDFAFDLATPPMCFLHGDADRIAPAMGSVKAWTRLREMGIQCDLHTLVGRGHCFQFSASDGTGSATWFDRILEFFTQKSLLK